jgi:carboxylate-amine ligase
MEFKPSPSHTVGVEWELQLIDPVSLDLVDGIIPLMEFFPDTDFVKPEYIQSCVELTSCIAENSDAAVKHLNGSLLKMLDRCTELEMGACGGGTHPFCRRLALITPLPRYQQLEESVGYLAHTQIAFSTHVHVGMSSGDEAMRAMRLLIPALSAFIALSANSPFWRGHQTGHVSYRRRILAAARNYGMPPRFSDWQSFDDFLSAALRSDTIRTFKDIHWDIRPHPDFGTLEIRAMDAASDLRTVHGLVAFARSLILCLAHAPIEAVSTILPLDLPQWIEKENCFRAGLLGLNAEYIVDAKGHHRPLRGLVAELLEFCQSTAVEFNETDGLAIARNLLNGVPGYERQLRAYEKNNSARSAVKALQDALLEGT